MKTNNFIGILITDCSSVPDSTIAAIGEVLRDTMHVNLENVTVKVMNENEIVQTLAQRMRTEDVDVDKNEYFEESMKIIYGDLSNKIAINASISDRIKIRIIKGCLREVLNNLHAPTKSEQEARTRLRYIITMIHSVPVEKRPHYCDITDKMFIEAILQLSKENENR